MHPLRNGSQVTARPARKATAGTPGYFSESNDNNQPSYPGQDWFNDVIDEFKNALAAANITYVPGDLTHLAQLFTSQTAIWLHQPYDKPIHLMSDIRGEALSLPPKDNPSYRYIKLSMNDSYNDDILINYQVSGSAPNLTVTAEIDLTGSPYHGTRIPLINTMSAYIKADDNPGVINQPSIFQHKHETAFVSNGSTSSWRFSNDSPWGRGSTPLDTLGRTETTAESIEIGGAFTNPDFVETGGNVETFSLTTIAILRVL
ncbi:hypothetical protein RUK84_002940 [Vibrio cholerae]|nr:hypothetical protein [Vibrio cholerae]